MTAPQQQKRKRTGPLVITANRLSDGKVVYLTAKGGWDTALARGLRIGAADAEGLLARARADHLQVVDPYAAPVALDAQGRYGPGNLRESIRSHGPSIALPVTALPARG